MSELTIEGVVTVILLEETGVSKAGKDWKKQEFAIETQDQYPKTVAFTCFGDKTDLLSKITVDQVVAVSFNLESREYNGKYFHNVNAWKIIPQQPSKPVSQQTENNIASDPENTDDLPF